MGLGEQNLGEFGPLPPPGSLKAAEIGPQRPFLAGGAAGLTPCPCQGCVNPGAQVRRRVETSPEGEPTPG